MTTTESICVTWKASSGRTYEIPLIIHVSQDTDYGADADGNRGVQRWNFEDYELDGMDESELPALITDADDLEEFSLEIISEEAFDRVMDVLCEC